MILVDIIVPATSQQFDFKLDENVYIAEVLEQIGEMMIPGDEEGKEELLLCSYETKRILPLDQTLKQNGIGNGSCLMLI